MAFVTFPSRPARASADVRRQIAPWSSNVFDPDAPLPNPWIAPILVPPGEPVDEREWLRLERNAAVSGALRARKARLLGDGVVLEPGIGEGAEELFDWWSLILEEIPLITVLDIAFKAIWRGWQPFEIVGADRDIDGRPFFVPVQIRDALSWHFRWTGRGDLVFCPPLLEARGYRMQTLPAMMKWWTPKAGSLSNLYGHPMHADYQTRHWAYTELSDAGIVQIKQAAGFLKVKLPFGLADALSTGDQSKIAQMRTLVVDMIEELQASGILVEGTDVETSWVALVSAIDRWIALLRWFDDVARGFYQGGNLSTMVSGATGSLAAGEVQERQGLSLAAVDASILEVDFRAGFLRPWSARNAALIAPRAFPGIGVSPRLEDVPLAAVPRLSFAALHKIRQDDLDLLRLFTEIGVIDTQDEEAAILSDADTASEDRLGRIDVEHHYRLARWRLLEKGQKGATLDTSRKAMTSPPVRPEPGPVDEGPEQDQDVNPLVEPAV